jgi:hypothetical protein
MPVEPEDAAFVQLELRQFVDELPAAATAGVSHQEQSRS